MEPTSPAVSCDDCARTWNSASMAEGLRLIGSCPRCGGTLSFREDSAGPSADPRPPEAALAREPHLVLGIPRR